MVHTNFMETLKFLGKKYLIEGRTIYRVNSSEVKQSEEGSQRFHFDSSEVRQSSERSQRFHFNGSEVK